MAKKKPQPKLGDQIIGDLDETIVTDPEEVEAALKDTVETLAPEDQAELQALLGQLPDVATQTAPEAPDTDPLETPVTGPVTPVPASAPAKGPNCLLEDGSRVLLDHGNTPPAFRVAGLDGTVYDHCSEAPNGEWVYRKQ